MPATTAPKTFSALLERTREPMRWVIARVPFDAGKVWGKRGQIRIQGQINGFAFRSTLFPTRQGQHFLIVNKKMQAGAKVSPGATARFQLAPDTAPRKISAPPKELLSQLKQSRRLMKFYESLSNSLRNDLSTWILQGKQQETRERRGAQMAERLMEIMEAERELPPMMQMVFRQSPGANQAWEKLSPSHRRSHLFRVFSSRDPELRARNVARCAEDLLAGSGRDAKRRALRAEEE